MKYEPNWNSLCARPTPQWFDDAKFGIFIHWGVYSVPSFSRIDAFSEWYMHQLDTEKMPEVVDFHKRVYGDRVSYRDLAATWKAELYDPDRWAEIFQKSGAKYINITSKHHDGFCLYETPYAVNWNSVEIGPHRDLLMELKTALAKTDVKFGVYHSIYEWYHPLFVKDPEQYALEHLHPMMKDLIERYEPWTLFTDGEWDFPAETWHSAEFLAWLLNESKVRDYIVPNDRWGKGTRGVYTCGNYTSEYDTIDGRKKRDFSSPDCFDKPFEECRGIGKSFGFNRIEPLSNYMSAEALIKMFVDLVSKGSNFLLDVGPAGDGTIPVIMEERLLQIGEWLAVNGEGIYGTRPYTHTIGGEIKYTKKGDAVYAFVGRYPWGEIALDEIPYTPDLKASVLGCDAPVTVFEKGGKAAVSVPQVNPDEMKSKYVYTIKIET